MVIKEFFFFFLVVVVPAQCKPRSVVQVVPGAESADSAIGMEGKKREARAGTSLFYMNAIFILLNFVYPRKPPLFLDPG